MDNTIHTLGLRVNDFVPSMLESNVDLNSEIRLEFNSDLDTSSILPNLFILKDGNFTFDIKSSEVVVSDFEKIDGSVVYKDKTIIFTPKSQLEKSCRYIIYVPRKSIKDISGKVLLTSFVAYFSTEDYNSFVKCEIEEPINNSTIDKLNKIVVSDIMSEKYLIQISKNKTFENIVFEKTTDSNSIEEELLLEDGMYYIRAKALNGSFGESIHVCIRSFENTIPTDQDLSENSIWDEFIDDEEVNYIESYPTDKDILVSEKTNTTYMKFKGEVDLDSIDFYESYLVGLPNDSDSKDNVEHEVDGKFSVIYNEIEDCTYIMFTPFTL